MTFMLPIRPRPKQRPRFANGHTYTPAETIAYERELRDMVRLRMNIEGLKPYQNWCHLDMRFQYEELRNPARIFDKRPDIDNLIKAVFDALNGTLYRDDAIIIRVEARKEYGTQDAILLIAEGE